MPVVVAPFGSFPQSSIFQRGAIANPGRANLEKIQNFTALVLANLDASDSESGRIFQEFSRSTRFSHVRTAPDSSQQKVVNVQMNVIWNFTENS